MTLIETMIYAALLAVLMTGFVNYSFQIHVENINLVHEINAATNE